MSKKFKCKERPYRLRPSGFQRFRSRRGANRNSLTNTPHQHPASSNPLRPKFTFSDARPHHISRLCTLTHDEQVLVSALGLDLRVMHSFAPATSCLWRQPIDRSQRCSAHLQTWASGRREVDLPDAPRCESTAGTDALAGKLWRPIVKTSSRWRDHAREAARFEDQHLCLRMIVEQIYCAQAQRAAQVHAQD